jgi:plastocyanin
VDARARTCEPPRLGIVLLLALGLLLWPSHAGAAETTYSFDVPTGTIGAYEVRQSVTAPVPHPPVDGYITHMQTDVVDADTGQPVPISRLMLHHIVFLNAAHRDNTCNSFLGFDNRSFGGVAPQRFFAAGEERAKISMPPGYGYPTKSSDPWAILAMVMNHRSTADHALIHYEVTVESNPLTPVKPYWLDVQDCKADPIYNVPGVERPTPATMKKKKKPKNSTKRKKRSAASAAGHRGKKHRKKKRKATTEPAPAPKPTSDATRDYVFPESGRIVAGLGHVHGGALGLRLTEPGCGDREIARSDPTWGLADHPFYTVRPVLHEPGPINMSAFRTPTGIPVDAGETIRLHSVYDDSQPHVRVMGIEMVYLAPDAAVTQPCGPLPGDREILKTNAAGRPGPVPFTIPLTGLDGAGQATSIDGPPGKVQDLASGSTIHVGDRLFDAPQVKIATGSTLTWQFAGTELHNLTLANGPLGIGSDNLDGNRTFTQKFDRPGTYRFFCALHPVDMSEKIVVADPAATHKKKGKKGKKGKRDRRKK